MSSDIAKLNFSEALDLADSIFDSSYFISDVLTSILEHIANINDNCQDSSVSVLLNDTLDMFKAVQKSLVSSFSAGETFIREIYEEDYKLAAGLKSSYESILTQIGELIKNIENIQPDVLS